VAFELRAKMFYAWALLAPLRRGRWSLVGRGLRILATGRDSVAPPY